MDFKKRAEIRTAALKKMISGMEIKRDKLLDEVANRKGRAEQLEELIKEAYETILDINKEEQTRENELLAKQAKEVLEEKAKMEREAKGQAFVEAAKGVRTPKPKRK